MRICNKVYFNFHLCCHYGIGMNAIYGSIIRKYCIDSFGLQRLQVTEVMVITYLIFNDYPPGR